MGHLSFLSNLDVSLSITISLSRGDAHDGRGELFYGLDARAVRPFGYVIVIAASVTLILYA